ncbi:cystathionine beta-lyase MetC [Clostridium pasteurianum DSM 525 = ATCC 6013]|uniref:cysteine-S-conjugate beta-lyase n=1 Tax=Clostridium pasteurianum DSM 525 = ATCC 6013 TaxID=1262449 RepID=A0A0H3J699_CLOPA|nr:aminotransferase class V-fold PLP-dependent enzyme [Clostridium pasteurianum]AJA48702.1 cystathionine beta-lyase MetC [Clostridium pasteurianum DSM 525 = ATCC 6013]AJA52690.1 cystathionine beta-lyase MetC [Clostridium pasteurianum DSM 525 = ATCC 6013]AOZ75928.1 cystathionine gamma-synthase [Clostridium pasteurianum DSM 525 = ATCC 6013]AOZ79724.1 cystathionine gamma-synthase [Clostridium pasteurianum]ELP60001.1 Cystathionine beta-lyase [Clostridium pasteurianum DSM 525 = ATCC 6013]
MDFGTKLIHNGNEIDKTTGALSIPIYHASTFHQFDIDNFGKYDYSRSGNPTREALENTIAALEEGDSGFAFSSGMAAISSVLSIFSAGDHILVCRDVYGGTYRVTSSFFKKFNVETTFIDATNIGEIKERIKNNTKAIFLESPSNPLLKITDFRAVIEVARKNNIVVIVDNTFMSPYLQNPIKLGADVVVHSATKFIGGHSDVISGLVVVKGKELSDKVKFVQNSFGAVLGPQDCWLLLRGLKTLKVRLDYQQKSALKLAKWLREQEEVAKVYYPGLLEHPGSELHLSQAKGGGAVLSFETKDDETAKRFMRKVKLAAVAVSLGGVETIVSYPAKMSHAAVPKEERESLGIKDSLIRVSLGLEETEDIIKDFKNALSI